MYLNVHSRVWWPLLQGQAGEWGPLDDVVMGGVSQSRFSVQAGAGPDGGPAGVFSGQVSSANSGGFASVSCTLPNRQQSGFAGRPAGGLKRAAVRRQHWQLWFSELHCAVQLGAEH